MKCLSTTTNHFTISQHLSTTPNNESQTGSREIVEKTSFSRFFSNCLLHLFYQTLCASPHYKATSGMSQGSVLGYLLFYVFINDVWSLLDTNYLLYADALKIYTTINSIGEYIQPRLQKCCDANKLELTYKSIVFSPTASNCVLCTLYAT